MAKADYAAEAVASRAVLQLAPTAIIVPLWDCGCSRVKVEYALVPRLTLAGCNDRGGSQLGLLAPWGTKGVC